MEYAVEFLNYGHYKAALFRKFQGRTIERLNRRMTIDDDNTTIRESDSGSPSTAPAQSPQLENDETPGEPNQMTQEEKIERSAQQDEEPEARYE
jgi:hypothetical protein